MNKFDEMILVVKRNVLFKDESNAFHGFLSNQEPKFKAIEKTLDTYEIKRRGDMEEDPSYKQLVSYCLLINERDEVLVYERLSGGGETRLHGSMSIGVGGHMNDFSNAGKFEDQMLENTYRELEEEVGLHQDDVVGMQTLGLINDDTNEVGQVHIGVVFKVDVKSEHISAVESDTLRIDWVDPKAFGDLDNYETWSALIIDALYKS